MQVEAVQAAKTLKKTDFSDLQVLVVDDEPTICDTLKLFLKHLGINHIRAARDGEEAAKEIEENPFDYIFMDLMMPKVNGMDVLKKINEYDRPTSVIIMTGYPSMEVVIDAMHNGASDFLVKPFRFEDVKLSLERLQRVHLLMEKNWLLSRELEKKKEVEELNHQLQKKIHLQTILYNIIDSLSKINRSENLYQSVVNTALESVNARKACFMIYDQGNSHLLVLSQQGLEGVNPGEMAPFKHLPNGKSLLDGKFIGQFFGDAAGKSISLLSPCRDNDFMTVPFNIRNEPFGVLLIGRRKDGKSFEIEDEFILKFLAEKTALNIENIALYDNLKQSLIATLMSLVSAIEAKDAYTQQHSSRVTEYSLKIARNMGYGHDDLQRIQSCAPLHDIGKIGINDNILNKQDRLTDEEFDHIKAHPIIGVHIVSPLGPDHEELAIIKNHHERWDGRGYPDGLQGKNIPRLARILAVADAFDAMNSSRAYRKALPFHVCLGELKKNAGSQFDPEIVEAALPVLSE